MIFREYNSGDRTRCIEIFNSNTPLYFEPGELQGFETWLGGHDEDRLAYKNTRAEYFYVALKENQVTGCGGFYVPKEGQRANLTWGMIDKAFHKQGIGSKFLEYRIQMIRDMYPGFIISMDTTQHSYKFFEKMGFRVTEVISNCYSEGLDRYDMIK